MSKAKFFVTYTGEPNLCWWIAEYCGINEYKGRIDESIICNVKHMPYEYYNDIDGNMNEVNNFVKQYEGFNVMEELEEFCIYYNVNIQKW